MVFALAGDSTTTRSKFPDRGAASPLPPAAAVRLRRAAAGSTPLPDAPVALPRGLAVALRVGFFGSVEGLLAGFLRGVGTDGNSIRDCDVGLDCTWRGTGSGCQRVAVAARRIRPPTRLCGLSLSSSPKGAVLVAEGLSRCWDRQNHYNR